MYFCDGQQYRNQTALRINLSLENDVDTDLVYGTGGADLVEALCIKRKTNAGLDTGAESLGVACTKKM
jgi:hypothetical protein